jgi:hypothetical protein
VHNGLLRTLLPCELPAWAALTLSPAGQPNRASPAPSVAIVPIKERRSLNTEPENADPDSRLSGFFDVIPALDPSFLNVALFYYWNNISVNKNYSGRDCRGYVSLGGGSANGLTGLLVRRSFPSDEPIKHSLESDQNLIFVLQVDVLPWQTKCFKATPDLISLPRSSILVLKGFEVRYRLALLLLALAVPAAAQDRRADMRTAFARVQHLKHGINSSEWFAQHASDYSAAFTGRYTDEADIALMAKLGFDNVRLSIDRVPLEQSMNH